MPYTPVFVSGYLLSKSISDMIIYSANVAHPVLYCVSMPLLAGICAVPCAVGAAYAMNKVDLPDMIGKWRDSEEAARMSVEADKLKE